MLVMLALQNLNAHLLPQKNNGRKLLVPITGRRGRLNPVSGTLVLQLPPMIWLHGLQDSLGRDGGLVCRWGRAACAK